MEKDEDNSLMLTERGPVHLHKLPGGGNRKNIENKRKLATFPVLSLQALLFLPFCHLEFHTWLVLSRTWP